VARNPAQITTGLTYACNGARSRPGVDDPNISNDETRSVK